MQLFGTCLWSSESFFIPSLTHLEHPGAACARVADRRRTPAEAGGDSSAETWDQSRGAERICDLGLQEFCLFLTLLTHTFICDFSEKREMLDERNSNYSN